MNNFIVAIYDKQINSFEIVGVQAPDADVALFEAIDSEIPKEDEMLTEWEAIQEKFEQEELEGQEVEDFCDNYDIKFKVVLTADIIN